MVVLQQHAINLGTSRPTQNGLVKLLSTCGNLSLGLLIFYGKVTFAFHHAPSEIHGPNWLLKFMLEFCFIYKQRQLTR